MSDAKDPLCGYRPRKNIVNLLKGALLVYLIRVVIIRLTKIFVRSCLYSNDGLTAFLLCLLPTLVFERGARWNIRQRDFPAKDRERSEVEGDFLLDSKTAIKAHFAQDSTGSGLDVTARELELLERNSKKPSAFQTPQWLHWLETKRVVSQGYNGNMFWINGIPGSGKSTLLIRLATSNRRHHNHSLPVQRPLNRHSMHEPVVQCSVGGISTPAFADSGADENYITEDEVKRRNYSVNMEHSSRVKLAAGQLMNVIGTVELPLQFGGEREVHWLTFQVVKSCIHDVILGSRFLWTTQTLTRYRHRITNVLRQASTCRVRYVGGPQLRISGLIDGKPARVMPDTGADISLISEDTARMHGWMADRSSEHLLDVEFADGSRGQTSGIVRNVPWTYGLSTFHHSESFYVYKGLDCPIILGYEFLERTRAFTDHEEDFTWMSDTEWTESQYARLSVIKLAFGRSDGGFALRDLLKRKKASQPMLVQAALHGSTVLPNTGISFNVNDILDHSRAEREMLRRRERFETELRDPSLRDPDQVRRAIDGWESDWDLLLALRPKPPSDTAQKFRAPNVSTRPSGESTVESSSNSSGGTPSS